jgi:hypothetical protein
MRGRSTMRPKRPTATRPKTIETPVDIPASIERAMTIAPRTATCPCASSARLRARRQGSADAEQPELQAQNDTIQQDRRHGRTLTTIRSGHTEVRHA